MLEMLLYCHLHEESILLIAWKIASCIYMYVFHQKFATIQLKISLPIANGGEEYQKVIFQALLRCGPFRIVFFYVKM